MQRICLYFIVGPEVLGRKMIERKAQGNLEMNCGEGKGGFRSKSWLDVGTCA